MPENVPEPDTRNVLIPINFPVRVSPKVRPSLPGLMGRVRLNELGRALRRSLAEGLGRFRRADNSACHREAEPERIAETARTVCPGCNCFESPHGTLGRSVAVYLDDRQVRQRIGPNQLRRQDPPVAHGHADIHRAIHHVIVGPRCIRREK